MQTMFFFFFNVNVNIGFVVQDLPWFITVDNTR